MRVCVCVSLAWLVQWFSVRSLSRKFLFNPILSSRLLMDKYCYWHTLTHIHTEYKGPMFSHSPTLLLGWKAVSLTHIDFSWNHWVAPPCDIDSANLFPYNLFFSSSLHPFFSLLAPFSIFSHSHFSFFLFKSSSSFCAASSLPFFSPSHLGVCVHVYVCVFSTQSDSPCGSGFVSTRLTCSLVYMWCSTTSQKCAWMSEVSSAVCKAPAEYILPCSHVLMMIGRAVRSDGPSSLTEHTCWHHSSLQGFPHLSYTLIAC